MTANVRNRPLRVRTLAVVGLYALLVMSAPVLHHDFACHQKSPTHCVSCVSNPSAPRATATVVVATALSEVGAVVEAGRRQFHERPLLTLRGRAPPA
jgi:hypothetical protein